ncbi:MAG TPA: hypothetical protein VIV08_04450 [Acidimicrobiia bacterium]
MPAIGWQQTLAALLELSVGPLGGNRKDARHAALKARERIAEALNVYGAHPALYGVGMVGLYSDVLPVWQRPDVRAPARLYDILPMGGESFVHLVPRYDGAFTVWDAVSPLPLWEGWDERPPSVLDPTGHMAFIVKGDVTVPESTPAGQEARD